MKILSVFLSITILIGCKKSSSGTPLFFIPPSASSSSEDGGITTSISEGATLKKIQIEPPSLNLLQDTHGEVSAVAIYSDGTKVDVTNTASWEFSDSTLAEVDNSLDSIIKSSKSAKSGSGNGDESIKLKRRIRAVTPGKTKIKATLENISGECELLIRGLSVK